MNQAGLRLDVLDDPDGAVLRSRFPTLNDVPELIKTGHVLTAEERALLPDDQFGVVMINGGVKLRKYAMVDPANTALSVMYFLENRHHFPSEAAKTAAARLTAACINHDIVPPAPLVVTAGEKLASLWPSSALRRLTDDKDKKTTVEREKSFSEYFTDPTLAARARALEEQDAQCDLEMDVVHLRRDAVELEAKKLELEQVQAARQPAQPVAQAPEAVQKVAYLYPSSSLRRLTGKGGDSAGPQPSVGAGGEKSFSEYFIDPQLRTRAQQIEEQDTALEVEREQLQLREDQNRLAAKQLELQQIAAARGPQAQAAPAQPNAVSPYVDTTGKESQPAATIKQASAGDCLLVINGVPKYPVRNMVELEKAAHYFEMYADRFTPGQRREYCTKLASKAAAVGLEMPELVAKYASMNLDPLRQAYFDLRVQALDYDPQAAHMYGSLSKVAHITDPEVLVAALADLDHMTGLDRFYNNGIPDPYFTLFGQTKVAEVEVPDMWTWQNEIGDSLNEEDLNSLLTSSAKIKLLKTNFSEDFVTKLTTSKDPIQVFESLPDPTKTIISRLAAKSSSPGSSGWVG